MSLQEQINSMTGPQLADFWNEHCEKAGKAKVTKFKDLTTGRDRCFHLAWELDMIQTKGSSTNEAGNELPSDAKQTEVAANADTVLDMTDADTSEGGKTAVSDQSSDEGPFDTSPLIGRLKLRAGTNKAKVATRLAKSAGGYVSHEDLVKEAYGDVKATKEYVGHLRMVLKGVKIAVAKYAPDHEVRSEKGSVGLFSKEQGE